MVGYEKLITDLEAWLADITGYDAVSLQPNAGSQGEFAGLLAIRGYHLSRDDGARNICLIPASAHGTNAASAVMAGFKVVVVKTADDGSIDMDDLDRALASHADTVGAIMITYPSTHGTYEPEVTEVTAKVHAAGGQVYIDGANLNALVGYGQPGAFGGRRLASQPAQDVRDSTRWRWARCGARVRSFAPRAVPAGIPRGMGA